MQGWTTQQVLDLAPDAASAQAGRSLARADRWRDAGRDERACWGLCQGSGSKPYQVRIDLAAPAFKCSCPSRKFPCKHALGLFLLLAGPDGLPAGTPPDWVAEWLASREAKAEGAAARKPRSAPPADPDAQARRTTAREDRMRAGVDELALWLRDLARRGIATLASEPDAGFERMAARLVDAQAPGAARLVRQAGWAASSGDGWQARVLELVGRLHLLAEAARRIDDLDRTDPAVAADVRSLLGVTVPLERVLEGSAESGRWMVLSSRVAEDERVRSRRTWLLSRGSGRAALVLAFAAGREPLDASLVAGTELDAELCRWPGALGLRAAVKSRGEAVRLRAPATTATCDDVLAAHAEALSRHPWLDAWPALLGPVRLLPPRGRGPWRVRDERGASLALARRFTRGAHLLAVSGGDPLTLFGEWTSEGLEPLGAWRADAYFTLQPEPDPLGAWRVA